MSSIVLLAALIGSIIGWVAHILYSEPNGPIRERQLVDAYSQGWRACEHYIGRRVQIHRERRNHAPR